MYTAPHEAAGAGAAPPRPVPGRTDISRRSAVANPGTVQSNYLNITTVHQLPPANEEIVGAS